MSYSSLMTNIWPPPNDEVKERLERLQELKQLREKRDASGTGTPRTDASASEGSRFSRRQLLNTRTLPTSRLRERQEERLKATLERKSQHNQLSASQEALNRANYGGARPKNISTSLRSNSSGTSEILASIRKNENGGLNHRERQRTSSAESDTFEDHGPSENVIYRSTSARLTSIGSLGSLTDERETEVKTQDVSVESENADHIEDIESFKQSLYGPASSPAKGIAQERVLTPFIDTSRLMDASEFSSKLVTSNKSESRGKVGDSARWRRNFPQSAEESSVRSEHKTQSNQEQTNGNESIQRNGDLDTSVEKTTVKPSESVDKTVAATTNEPSGSSETTAEQQSGSENVMIFDGESMKVMGKSNGTSDVLLEKESLVSPNDMNVVQSSHENSVENESSVSRNLDSSLSDRVVHGTFNVSDQLSNFSVQSQAGTSDYRDSILDESDSIFDTKYDHSVLEEEDFSERDSWLSDRTFLGEGSTSYSNRSAWQTDRPTFDRSGGYAPKQSRHNVLKANRTKPSTTRISRYTSLPNSADSRIAGFRSKYLNQDYSDSYGSEGTVTSSYRETESENISSRLGNILSDSFKRFDSVLEGSDLPKRSEDPSRNLRRSYSQKVDGDNDSRFSRFRRTSETNGERDFDSSVSRYRRSSDTNSDGEFRSRYDTGSSSLQQNPGMHEFISDIRSRMSGERTGDTTRSSFSKPLARTNGASSVLENAKRMLMGITDEPEVGVHDQQFEDLRHQTEQLTETLVSADINVNVTKSNGDISGSDVLSEEDVIDNSSEARLEKGDIIQLTPEPDKQLDASEKETGGSQNVKLNRNNTLKVTSDSVTAETESAKNDKDEETTTGKVEAEKVTKCSENDKSDNTKLVKADDSNSKQQSSNKGKSKKKKKGKKKKNSDDQSDASNDIESKNLDGKKIEISQSEDVLTVTIEDTKADKTPQEVESTGSVGKQFETMIDDIDHRSEKTSVATEDLLSLIGKGEGNESVTSKTGSSNSKKTANKSNKDSTDTTSSQIPDENFATFEGEDLLALTKNENVSVEGSSLPQTDAEQFETASEEEFYEALPGEMVDEEGNAYVEHREQFIYVTAGSKVRKKKLSKKSLLGEKSTQEVINAHDDVHDDTNLGDRMKSQVDVDSSRIGHVKEWMESNIFPSNNALDEKDFKVKSSDQGSHFSVASTIGDFDSRGSLDSKDKSEDGKTIKNESVFSSVTSTGSTLSEKKNSSMQTNVSLLNTRDSATQMLIKSRNIGVQIDAEMYDKFIQTIGELVCPCCKHKFNIQEGFGPTADDIKVNDKDVQKVKEELELKLEIKVEEQEESKPGSLKTSSNSSASSKSSSSRNSMATPPKSPSVTSSALSTKRSPRGTPNEKSPNVTPRKQSPSAVKRTQSLGEKPNRKSPSTTPRKQSPARKSPVTTPRKQSPSRKSPATTPRKQSPAREGARTPNTKSSTSHQAGQSNGETNKGPNSKVRKERVSSVQDLLYQNGEQMTEKKPETKRRPTTPGPKREKSSERQKREASGDRRSDDGSSEKSDLPGYMQPTKSSRKKKSIGNKDDLLEEGKQKKGTKNNTETDDHEGFTTMNENPFIRSDRQQSSTGANSQRSSGKWYRKEPLKYEEEHKKGKPRTPKKQRSTSTSSEKSLARKSDMKTERMLKSNEKLNLESMGSQNSLLETDLDEAMGCRINKSETSEDSKVVHEFVETIPYQNSHFLGPDLKSYAENVSRNIAELEAKKLTSNSNQNEDATKSNGQLSLPPGAESEKNEAEVTQTLDEKDGGGSKQKLLSDEEQTGVPVETETEQDEVAPVRVNLTSWDPTKLLKDLYAVKLMPDTAKDISDKFVAMEGLMEKLPMNKKKATLLKTWKRRFFRATDGWLYYYETSNHDKPSDSLQLMGGKVDDLGNRILGVDDGRGKFLMVRCPTDKEYGQWKLALESQTADNVKATYVRPVLSCPPHPKKKVLLIDIGSSAIRAGILGEHATLPMVFFPNMAAHSTDGQGHVVGIEAFEPEYRKTSSKTVHPTDKVDKDFLRPFSIDISTIGAVFKKIFTDLKVEPADYWLMISTPQNLGDKIRAGLMEVLIDAHHVQGVCMVMQSLLALYSYNATSGIIVDIGERMEILPIYDGFVIEGGVSRQSYGGQKVIESLNSCLHGYKFSTPIQQLLVRYVMEQSCYLVTDYKDTLKKCEQDPENYRATVYLNNFDLPEGAALEVTHDDSCFKSPEGFFNTDLWGMDYPCVHKLVFQAIQSCPIDSRKRMYRAIYLSGGVTMLPGFAERLQSELQTLAPPSVVVEVHASPQRYHSAFIGACSLASMEQFLQICISAEEWKKDGVKAFKKWNMSG